MTKSEFLHRLREGLSGLPQSDVDERLMFYSEMIEDRIEEGMSEEEAVAGIGNIDDIISEIAGDVTGTVRTGKAFRASSRSGDISVPDTNGQNCEIKTGTGDISIRIG